MYVYILKSKVARRRYYTGLTDDPARRLAEHNAGESSFTRDDKPWKLVSYHWFETADRAKQFESYLKTGSGRAFAKRHL